MTKKLTDPVIETWFEEVDRQFVKDLELMEGALPLSTIHRL